MTVQRDHLRLVEGDGAEPWPDPAPLPVLPIWPVPEHPDPVERAALLALLYAAGLRAEGAADG